jgi:uncharacterized protein
MEEKNFQKIQVAVEKELSCSAHNMDHVLRVYNLALHLAKGENVDLDVLKAAALLHDIARVKEDNDQTGQTDHAILSAEMCVQILKEVNFSAEKIKHVQDCIISHRYRTGNEPKTLEAKILFDADKLDTIGAIGIARSFVWVGGNKAKIYSDIDLDKYIAENLGGKINGRIQDKTKHSPQIEYKTKLVFLAEKLNTAKAKEVCKERLEFFENFLKRLEQEIKGEI